MLFRVNIFGLDICFTIPCFSRACMLADITADPVLFIIPTPLFPLKVSNFVNASLPVPSPPVALTIVLFVFPVLVPIVPPIVSPCL